MPDLIGAPHPHSTSNLRQMVAVQLRKISYCCLRSLCYLFAYLHPTSCSRKTDAMQYEKRFHLFNSSGVWIGFCQGSSVFDTLAVWRGWFPWEDSADVVTPQGGYLGTVVGNRFYSFDHKKNVQARPCSSCCLIPFVREEVAPVAPKKLPDGASDVELKPLRLRQSSSSPLSRVSVS